MPRPVLPLAVVALVHSLAAGVPFENPVFREDAPDPTVWTVADGTYRAASTANAASVMPQIFS